MTTAQLVGQTEQHLCSDSDAEVLGARVHSEVVRPFLQLKHEARLAGFDLTILSGFRDYERQLSIWNRKATGQQAVLDSASVPINIEELSEKHLAFAIMRWSALPGASRHHWGTDLDIFDAAARPDGYEIELLTEEVESGGMFGPLHDWLDRRITTDTAFGFFRPYDQDRNGVAPERWHLSYAPVATPYEKLLSTDVIRHTVENGAMELKTAVLSHLDEIYRRFVTNTGRPAT